MTLGQPFDWLQQPPAPIAGVRGMPPIAGLQPWRGRAAARFAVPFDPLRIALFLLTVVSIGRIHQQVAAIALLRPALVLVIAATVYAVLNPRLVYNSYVNRLWPASVL